MMSIILSSYLFSFTEAISHTREFSSDAHRLGRWIGKDRLRLRLHDRPGKREQGYYKVEFAREGSSPWGCPFAYCR
jgi:hypothetical protein